MLFFFLAIFLPYQYQIYDIFDVKSTQEFEQIKKSKKFCVLLIADSNEEKTAFIKSQFINATSLFSNEPSSFCFLDSSKSKNMLTRFGQNPPCLVFYKLYSEWLIIPFPRSEESLLFLLQHYFSQSLNTANSEADILSYLGHFDFTLLITQDLIRPVLSLRYKASAYIGNMDIIVCDKKVLEKSFHIKNGEIGIYRAEDRTIQSIKPEFDAVLEATIPSYRYFVNSDFKEPNATFVAFLGLANNFEYQLQRSYNDIIDLLYTISNKFPQFIVGYLEPKLHYIAKHSTLENFDNLPTIVSFSTFDRSYFPVPSNFFQTPFNKDKWAQDAISYLTHITKGKIKRKYHSLLVPQKTKNDPVEVLVGTTYESFMKDTKHDLYVLYVAPNDEKCNEALSVYREAAKLAKSIRFAVIDAFSNSSPVVFPHLHVVPYIRFYPAVNRSNDMPFLHLITTDNLLRFANTFGSKQYNFDVPRKTRRELRIEMGIFSRIIAQLPPKDQEKTEPYFKALVYEIGIN